MYREFPRQVASGGEQSGPAMVLSASVGEVTAALGHQYFAPNWEFSYYERGEDLNVARVEYDRLVVQDHEYIWWQTYVRGWMQADESIRLRPHYELEPTEYDQDHINGIGLDVPKGMERVTEALAREGLAYEEYEDLPAGGT